MTQHFDVFVNYNSRDSAHAERPANTLREVGLRVWIDVSELLPGQNWFHEAAHALQNCRTVLVLIGEHGVERYDQGEIQSPMERATRSDFLLIPVLLPGSLPEQLPLFLHTRVYCDLRKWDKDHLTRLIDAVRPTPKVFLCHAKEDGERVQQLADYLQGKRIDAWFDKQKLKVGVNWREEIAQAIENTDFFAACLSKTAVNKRGFIQNEIRTAVQEYQRRPFGSVFLLPVKLEPCEVPRIRLDSNTLLGDLNGSIYRTMIRKHLIPSWMVYEAMGFAVPATVVA